MHLNYIKLINFRNFSELFINLEEKVNIFCGKNGQGKTNIAESIYIIFNGKSFRKGKREELINYDKEYAEIKAELEIEKSKLNLRLLIERDKRELNINEKTKKKPDINYYRKSLLLNSDLLFYCKNFLKYRIALLDKLCFLFFGENFYFELKKYKRVVKQYRLDTKNQIWAEIFIKQRKKVNEYRKIFLKNVEEETKKTMDLMKINDVITSFDCSDKTQFNFLRRDKKDLSLGEYKSAIFSLVIAYAKAKGKGQNVLIIDDFNSEWDNEKINCAIKILNETNLQCFLMSSEFINIYPHYLVEKGEVKRYG